MKERIYKEAINIVLVLFIIVFCIAPKISTLFLILYALLVVFGWINKNITFRWNLKSFWFVGFYLVYLLGVFYTKDSDQALKYLENKLPFLIFPFFFCFDTKKIVRLPSIVTGLLIGVTALSFIGYWKGFVCYGETGALDCLMTISLSPIHHPSYFVVFHFVALVFTWHGYLSNWKFYKLKWIIPFTLFSFITQCLALSLAGILYLLLLVVITLLYLIKRKWGVKYFIFSTLLIPFLVTILFLSVPQFEGEFNGAFKYVNSFIDSPTEFVETREKDMSGSEVRLVMWTATISEILDHPFGVGTGNVDIYLGKRLTLLNQPDLAKYNYNPHNQFLQTTLEIGVFGLFLLLGLIIHISYLAWRQKNWILLILVSNLFFNSLFESMLQRQSGIVFYTFWIVLLLSIIPSTKKLII